MDKVCSPIAESQLSTIEFVKKEKKEQNQEQNSCRDDQFFFFPLFYSGTRIQFRRYRAVL